MGCQVVITRNGFAETYFKEDAFYCDPSQPASILAEIEKAAKSSGNNELRNKITGTYSWQQSAEKISAAYKKYIC
jgi:glycosyltransferase involved in cell wall biosynthesis